jgi:ParB family chromosome partitioning protein
LFELVAGERRWRAAQLAGLTSIPVIIRDIPDDRLLELALVENIQRQELNPIEEANAYKKLIESLSLSHEELAQRVGRDRTFVTNYLRLLKLPSEIQLLLEAEKLSFGHGRALLGLADPQSQCRLAQKILKHNWSVRETERRIRNMTRTEKPQTPTAMKRHDDPNVRAAEAKLRRHLGTHVRIQPLTTGTPGKIEIEYYSPADLNRLYEGILSTNFDQRTASASTAF